MKRRYSPGIVIKNIIVESIWWRCYNISKMYEIDDVIGSCMSVYVVNLCAYNLNYKIQLFSLILWVQYIEAISSYVTFCKSVITLMWNTWFVGSDNGKSQRCLQNHLSKVGTCLSILVNIYSLTGREEGTWKRDEPRLLWQEIIQHGWWNMSACWALILRTYTTNGISNC